MKVLVCGGRDFTNQEMLFGALDKLDADERIGDVIHGAARGADMLAHEWAHQRQRRMWPYTADWKRDGRAAGPIRNKRMLDEGKPDLVVAFPGGRGTANMVDQARKAGVRVIEVG